MNLRPSLRRSRRNCFILSFLVLIFVLYTKYSGKTPPDYPNISNAFCETAKNDLIQDVREGLPSFPVSFWEKNRKKGLYFKNSSCAAFPNLYTLKVNNLYWQILSTSKGNFYLFGAYLDVRERCRTCPAVRILGMIDRVRPTIQTFCQLWFADSSEPIIVQTMKFQPIYLYPDRRIRKVILYGYIITCPMPRELVNRRPVVVSLVEKGCDIASNSLRVVYNKLSDTEKKRRFGVCVKASYFLYEDLSVRLIEWIELLLLMGAEKIFFYLLHAHRNITKVLDHYEKRGQVEVTPFTFAGDQPNMPGLQHLYIVENKYKKFINEHISLNDCFYKNMYRYDFIVILDVDEVIVPRKVDNWEDLMNTVLKKSSNSSNNTRTNYIAKNVLFTSELDESTELYQDIPPYMHMMQHVLRNKVTRGNYHKSFFVTEEVVSVWNHWPTKAFELYSEFVISPEDAQTHHYRRKNYRSKRNLSLSDLEADTVLWKYKKALIERTLATLYDLKFFG